MKLDEIQDIEVLRKLLKELMCKCIKEIELKNRDGEILKTVPGEYYYYDHDGEWCIYGIFDGTGYMTDINEYDAEDYFAFPKEGDV